MQDPAAPPLKYEPVFREFMRGKGWAEEEIDVDLDGRTVSYWADATMGRMNGRLDIKADEGEELVDFLFRFEHRCPEARYERMLVALNAINHRSAYGAFSLVLEDGSICWRHRIHFQGTTLTAAALRSMAQGTMGVCWRFSELIEAVALSDQPLAEVLVEHDALWKRKDREAQETREAEERLRN